MRKDKHNNLVFIFLQKQLPKVCKMACIYFACLLINDMDAQTPMAMRLVAAGNGMQNEAVVYFDSSATYNYDPLYDAPSLGVAPGQLNIVTCLNNLEYQVNGLPALTQSITLPVKITTGTTGQYQLSGVDLQNLPQGAWVTVTDLYNNVSHNLRTGPFTCTIQDTETVARFELGIVITTFSNLSIALVAPTCLQSADGKLIVQATSAGPYDFYWKDSLNNIVHSVSGKAWADTFYTANAGIYRVDVNETGTNKIGIAYFNVHPSMGPQADFMVSDDTLYLSGSEASMHFFNNCVNAQWYWWDFGDGMGCDSVNPTYAYTQLGTYTVTLSANNGFCPETASFSRSVTILGGTTGIARQGTEIAALCYEATGCYLKFKTEASNLFISISDLMGRVLLSWELSRVTPGQKILVSGALPPKEVYMLYLSGIHMQKVYKFITLD